MKKIIKRVFEYFLLEFLPLGVAILIASAISNNYFEDLSFWYEFLIFCIILFILKAIIASIQNYVGKESVENN